MKQSLGLLLLKLFGLPATFTGQLVINFHRGNMSVNASKTVAIKAIE